MHAVDAVEPQRIRQINAAKPHQRHTIGTIEPQQPTRPTQPSRHPTIGPQKIRASKFPRKS
jgi:hypothetical protein